MAVTYTDHTLHLRYIIRRIDLLVTFLPLKVTIKLGILRPYLLNLKYGMNSLCFCHFINAMDFDNIFIDFGGSYFKIKPTFDCSYVKITLFKDKNIPSLQMLARIKISNHENFDLSPQLIFNLDLEKTNIKLALGFEDGLAYSCSHASG